MFWINILQDEINKIEGKEKKITWLWKKRIQFFLQKKEQN